MKTLVYKRTHHGDPDPSGQFGINDCMGSVRGWDYEAVIGVGGIGKEPETHGIAGKITWIGIGPNKTHCPNRRGPIVTFNRFVYFGASGPLLVGLAPNLAAHIYGRNVRVLLRATAMEKAEIDRILKLAHDAPPSPALAGKGLAASDRQGALANRCATAERTIGPSPVRQCGGNEVVPPSQALRPSCKAGTTVPAHRPGSSVPGSPARCRTGR